ncbi:MAG: hypothetical protein D6715_12540 [Calditrichaeota bacterium]|nr:MAG: hypothetical protein D6715_12540 [Calditrichota bacterium]
MRDTGFKNQPIPQPELSKVQDNGFFMQTTVSLGTGFNQLPPILSLAQQWRQKEASSFQIKVNSVN